MAACVIYCCGNVLFVAGQSVSFDFYSGRPEVAPLHGCGDMAVFPAALQVGAGPYGIGGGSRRVGACAVLAGKEVADGSAVAHHKPLVTPLVAENALEQFVAAAAWTVVVALVGAHHLAHVCVLNECLECRKIGLAQIAFAEIVDIEGVAFPFRSAVYGEMLRAGICLAVFRRVRTLQTAHHGGSHAAGQIGVFAICFLPAAPSRIAENIDIRCLV